jgi:hypothetical protein
LAARGDAVSDGLADLLGQDPLDALGHVAAAAAAGASGHEPTLVRRGLQAAFPRLAGQLRDRQAVTGGFMP